MIDRARLEIFDEDRLILAQCDSGHLGTRKQQCPGAPEGAKRLRVSIMRTEAETRYTQTTYPR